MSGGGWDAIPLRPVPNDDGRPEILVGPDESRVVDEALVGLAGAQEVFTRGGQIVEVITDEPRTPGVVRGGPIARVHGCAEPRIRELLAREIRWTARDEKKGYVTVHPPGWAVKAVAARGSYPMLRPLVAVAEAPTMRQDGSLLDRQGYDAATGIYLATSLHVTVGETIGDARAALALLLDVIRDFPIVGKGGRSVWVSGVLSVVARPAIDGPVPMHIIDASTRGAGKSLLADGAAILATGRPAPRMLFVRNDEEMRKRITALALVGDPFALLDNVVGELGCAPLDAALTGTTWADRMLGVMEMTPTLPMMIVWWATGNGLVVGADLARRALFLRIEPLCEHPEERTGFAHPRLLDYVRAHRAELLGAALTVVRAYVVAGRPDQGLVPMGSFEAWSDLVRSALVWAGEDDPVLTVGDLRAVDSRADSLRRVIEEWPAEEGKEITAGGLLAAAAPETPWRAALVEWCPPRGEAPLPTARSLGNRLKAVRRSVIGKRLLDVGAPTREGATWVVRTLDGGTP